ncbi:hypothetical protein L7F22_026399 [Adiantum nelumboides]|nr:hypothetical protein [Adiantum nelumboides]
MSGHFARDCPGPKTPSPSPPSASSAEATETKSSPKPKAASTSKELVFKGKDKAQETPPSEVKQTPKNIKEDGWKTVQGKKPLNKLGNAAPSKPLQENSNKSKTKGNIKKIPRNKSKPLATMLEDKENLFVVVNLADD